MEKFHHFLYASLFILETDQKPLEAILSKSLKQTTPDCQMNLIRTFPYYFTVCFIPCLTNQLADCLFQLAGQKDTINLPSYTSTRLQNSLMQEVTALINKEVPNVIQPY